MLPRVFLEFFRFCGALALLTFSLSAGAAVGELRTFLFDCGTADSPVQAGFTRVTDKTVYSPAQGFGWDRPAQASFNDHMPVAPKFQALHPHFVGPVTEPALRDGVEDDQPLTFILDAPPGRYWVGVDLGRFTQARHDMIVKLNGTVVATNIDAWGHVWGSHGGTRSKCAAFLAEPVNGQIRLTFDHAPSSPESWKEYSYKPPENGKLWYLGQNKNSILAIRARPFVAAPLRLETNRIEGAIASAELRAARDQFQSGQTSQAIARLKRLAPANLDDEITAACLTDCFAGSMSLADNKVELELMERSMASWQKILDATPPQSATRFLAEARFESAQRYHAARRYVEMLAYTDSNKRTGLNNYHRYWAAYDLCGAFVREDPLYFKSHLLRGRVAKWNGHEGHWKNCYDLADAHFAVLKAVFPEHRLVRLYTGERVPAPARPAITAPGAPEWARLQCEALDRYLDLIHFWVEKRQAPNGELGGNWGDDVEILRGWAPAVLAINDPVALRGIRKMADGVWNSGEVENGFSKTMSDVEHGAELVSDTQPLMCGIDYGNPEYLERCMASMRSMREVWTAVNAHGHRHFKAHHYSATQITPNPIHLADVALNGRAVNPGIWLLWYNHHPAAIELLGQWCRAWIEDAARTDGGKPAGFVPGSIRFEDDHLGGFADSWWQTKDYFSDFESVGYTATLYNTMFAMFAATGDEFYMTAIRHAAKAVIAETRQPSPQTPTGSAAWAARICDDEEFGDVVAKYRLFTGSPEFDNFLLRRGSPYVRWVINGQTNSLVLALSNVVEQLSCNIELSTSEVLFTDRVALPGSDILFEMMSGSAGEPGYYPVHAVTWEGIGTRTAILVERGTATGLQAQLFSFAPESREITLRPWRLTPGEYQVTLTPLDVRETEPTTSRLVKVSERGEQLTVKIPSRTLCRLTFAPKPSSSPTASNSQATPDPAFGSDAILITDPVVARKPVEVRLALHNLGSAPTPPVTGSLFDGKVKIADVKWPALGASSDLQPRFASTEVKWIPKAAGQANLRLVLNTKVASETVMLNNTAELRVEVLRP